MTHRSSLRAAIRWLAISGGLAAGSYLAYVAIARARYGHASAPAPDEEDPLLDRFMPEYEVAERHHIRVAAPAAVALAAAREVDLFEQPLVRAILRSRALLLGARANQQHHPSGLLASAQSMGWVLLAEVPDRQVVVGAVTKPWEPNVTFHGVPPDAFAAFAKPGYVKIAWTLRADPDGPDASMFRSETRAISTDSSARTLFRRYWSYLSPGIILIRWLALRPVKVEAECRARAVTR
jgi:hypothetical protein